MVAAHGEKLDQLAVVLRNAHDLRVSPERLAWPFQGVVEGYIVVANVDALACGQMVFQITLSAGQQGTADPFCPALWSDGQHGDGAVVPAATATVDEDVLQSRFDGVNKAHYGFVGQCQYQSLWVEGALLDDPFPIQFLADRVEVASGLKHAVPEGYQLRQDSWFEGNQ